MSALLPQWRLHIVSIHRLTGSDHGARAAAEKQGRKEENTACRAMGRYAKLAWSVVKIIATEAAPGSICPRPFSF
jgi:hypothetical protein